jgi:uncharacterized protein YktA (UPF0223 family)
VGQLEPGETLLSADAIIFLFHFGISPDMYQQKFMIEKDEYLDQRESFKKIVPDETMYKRILKAFEDSASYTTPLADLATTSGGGGGGDGQCPIPGHVWGKLSSSKNPHVIFHQCRSQFKELMPNERFFISTYFLPSNAPFSEPRPFTTNTIPGPCCSSPEASTSTSWAPKTRSKPSQTVTTA